METIDHIVEFDKYCKTCIFRGNNDKKGEEPCNECLDNPINQNSRKPVKYKEDINMKHNKSEGVDKD